MGTTSIVTVPRGYPTSVIFIDESGSAGSAGRYFVLGFVKTRRPGELARELRHIRDRHQFETEFKFADLTRGRLATYQAVVDVLADSDARIGGLVVDRNQVADVEREESWQIQARLTARLVAGCTNRRELVTVLVDSIPTPRGFPFADVMKRMANRRLDSMGVISAVSLDSRSNDVLQVADLVASAIAFDRRAQARELKPQAASGRSPKLQLTRYLQAAFGVASFDDQRADRISIQTAQRR